MLGDAGISSTGGAAGLRRADGGDGDGDGDGDGAAQLQYSSTSPDEEALVRAAALPSVGIRLLSRSPTTIVLDTVQHGRVHHTVLDVCEFKSSRMRMSVVAESPSGEVTIYTKGADNVVLSRISTGQVPDDGASRGGQATSLKRASAPFRP
jgi:magnesium-transporting ATPase (P-type)